MLSCGLPIWSLRVAEMQMLHISAQSSACTVVAAEAAAVSAVFDINA